jgi:hypothetical protein
MKKRELKELLERVETWPKEVQDAVFDSVSEIEAEMYTDAAAAEDLIRSREDIRHGRVTSQEDLIHELHLFGN